MAKKGKGVQVIHMKSTEGDGHMYHTRVNKQKFQSRMELRKYNPKLKKHVLYREEKKSK